MQPVTNADPKVDGDGQGAGPDKSDKNHDDSAKGPTGPTGSTGRTGSNRNS